MPNLRHSRLLAGFFCLNLQGASQYDGGSKNLLSLTFFRRLRLAGEHMLVYTGSPGNHNAINRNNITGMYHHHIAPLHMHKGGAYLGTINQGVHKMRLLFEHVDKLVFRIVLDTKLHFERYCIDQ